MLDVYVKVSMFLFLVHVIYIQILSIENLLKKTQQN